MYGKKNVIYQDLLKKITHQIYAEGTYLPSENELSALYGVSRETIRKSLAALMEDGFIHKIKGKGSLILPIQKYTFPLSSLTSFQELKSIYGMNTETKLIQFEETTVPTATYHYDTEQSISAFYLERLRIIDDEPMVIDRDYLVKELIPNFDIKIASQSLYHYFEQTLHLEIGYASKEFTVEQASPSDCKLLGLPTASYVAVVRSITHLQDNTVLSFTTAIHRPDKFRFVEHATRNSRF